MWPWFLCMALRLRSVLSCTECLSLSEENVTRFFAPLRMTNEGIRMTYEGLRPVLSEANVMANERLRTTSIGTQYDSKQRGL